LYSDRSSEETHEHGGRLKFKINIFFIVTTHEPLYLDKRSFVQENIMDIPTNFIRIIIFFNGPFEYGDGDIANY
jgi:hypothetical protein